MELTLTPAENLIRIFTFMETRVNFQVYNIQNISKQE